MLNMMVTGVCLAGATLLLSAPAHADQQGTDVGKPCSASELNQTAQSPSGADLRCLATGDGGFSWAADAGAVSTIAKLQNEGYTVTIDRTGSKPLNQCTVNNVWGPKTATRTDRSNPGAVHPETIVLNKTINVSLNCA